MNFNTNIKFLRKRKGRTQDDVAGALGLTRSTMNNYENQIAQPGMENLIRFSEYYGVAIDTLVKVDLTKLRESQLSQLEKGYDVFIRGSNLRVLATTVDQENEENIELVSEKASAGYASGFADPEYIRVLPTFQLPFLSKEKKFRTFQINGDSMLPIPNGSWVTGEFIQNWNFIRNKQAHIIITINDGIMFKVVENRIAEDGQLRLHSLNPNYLPYSIHINEIREIWKFVHYISSDMPETRPTENEIMDNIREIKEDVRRINDSMIE
ncbi:MAG: DNA-binding protein [Bacteroidetes bacterium 4484_276]|nr:MAG: DNA-binding protein [Bacteroidetes bacterium 4484_276]